MEGHPVRAQQGADTLCEPLLAGLDLQIHENIIDRSDYVENPQ
jgi:hypothetical protein